MAGGPTPPIPRLDTKQVEVPGTMAEHAMRARGIAQPNLQIGDILPEAAMRDPLYRQGQGARMAANQPDLAMKYGVVRNGNYIPPQALQPQKERKLSPETVQGLQQLAEFQLPQQEAPKEPEPQLQDIGKTTEEAFSKDQKQEIKEALKEMDEFQLDQFRQAITKDPLNNEEQRKIIESRLKPMTIDELIMTLTVTQDVPIIPGKLIATFKHPPGDVDLAIKRMIMNETKSLEVSERYFLDKFALMALCANLHAINNKPFPDYRDDSGEINEEMFYKRLNRMLRLPMYMLASLGINAQWFDARVKKLFVADVVGNG